MSPPIRDGSGDSIGSIRLGDGSEISEVRTGAGDVLFSGNAIPDTSVSRPNDNNSGSRSSADGVEFVLADNFSENGYRISNNTSGATRARVIDLSDSSTIATKDISGLGPGDPFTITADYQAGQNYTIVLDDEGGTYIQGFLNNSAEGQQNDGPYESEDVNIIGGVTSETDDGAAIANIIEVGNVGFS